MYTRSLEAEGAEQGWYCSPRAPAARTCFIVACVSSPCHVLAYDMTPRFRNARLVQGQGSCSHQPHLAATGMPFASLLREAEGEGDGADPTLGCRLEQSGAAGHVGKTTSNKVTVEGCMFSLPPLRTPADGRGKGAVKVMWKGRWISKWKYRGGNGGRKR